jgi:Trypsin-co-occurring domain 2
MNDLEWVDVSDAIGQLRAQLSEARAAAVDEELLFSVDKAEVELVVEARREAGAGGGIRFGVVSLEGKGSVSSTSSHRLRLELTPHDRAGRSVDIGDQIVAPSSQ